MKRKNKLQNALPTKMFNFQSQMFEIKDDSSIESSTESSKGTLKTTAETATSSQQQQQQQTSSGVLSATKLMKPSMALK